MSFDVGPRERWFLDAVFVFGLFLLMLGFLAGTPFVIWTAVQSMFTEDESAAPIEWMIVAATPFAMLGTFWVIRSSKRRRS